MVVTAEKAVLIEETREPVISIRISGQGVAYQDHIVPGRIQGSPRLEGNGWLIEPASALGDERGAESCLYDSFVHI